MYLVSFLSNIMVSYDGGLTWLDDIKISTTSLNKQYRTPIDYEQKVVGNTAWAPEEIQVLNNISSDQTGVVPNPKDRNEAVLFSRACFYKTTDGGKNFRDSSTLFTGFWWGTFDEGILFDKLNPERFVTFNADLGMAITENGGKFFTVRNLDRQVYYDGIISWFGQYAGDFQPVKDSKTIVASVGYYSDTKLVYTTDAGLNWHLCNNGAIPNGNYSYIKFHPNDPNVVYAGDKISYDSGKTFEAIPFLTQHHARLFGMSPSNPDIIYAFGWEKLLRVVNKVYRSDDRGKNWKLYTQIDGNLAGFGSRGFAFEVHPKNPDIIYTLDGNGDIAVYDGQLWKSLGVLKSANAEEFKPYVGSIAIDSNFPNIIYAKLRGSGIDHMWRSIDGGKTWRNISYNLPRMGGSGININPHTGELFNAALFGTWIFPPPYKSNNMVYERKITRPFPGTMPAVHYGKIMDENNNFPADNLVVRIYDESGGQLIGECITKGGYYYIVADSDDPKTEEKEGAAETGKTVIKIIKDGNEYILYTNSKRTENFISHKSGSNAETQLFAKGVSLEKK